MTTDILDLPGWTLIRRTIDGHEYELEAEYTVQPTACQKCGVVGRLYRHGTKETVYRDSPIRGHATRIRARVQRYRCRDCGETFLQPLAGIQEARRIEGAVRVLVACEFSGVVRRAFRERGHDAWSCDLLPAEDESPHHLQCDVLTVLDEGWDLMIAHPPCTHLAVSGARWFREKRPQQEMALRFVRQLLYADIPRIALENHVSIISTAIRKPDQIIQPWQFGHGETKATCLWLKNLPPLQPTRIVDGRHPRVHHMPPGPDRWKERSRTYQGIADAMAEQWWSESI